MDCVLCDSLGFVGYGTRAAAKGSCDLETQLAAAKTPLPIADGTARCTLGRQGVFWGVAMRSWLVVGM